MKTLRFLLPGVLGLFLMNSVPVDAQVVKDENVLLPSEKFFARAVECDTFEIQLADLAKKHASSQEVKDLAQKISDQHSKARKELTDGFKGKVAVVAGLDKDHKAEYDRMSKLNGQDFDRAYIQGVIDRHQKALKMCQANAKSDQAAVTQYCQTCSKAIEDHLRQAKEIQGKIGKDNK